ncbi:MAG: hypothetical protein KAW12_06335 [Candidatus Aminicenantes bacterium]|nr:hypothetical protein [Candidatus Aminicenantes bacterium]
MIKKITIVTMVILMTAVLAYSQGRGQGYNERPLYRNRVNRLHTFDVTAAAAIEGKVTKVEKCIEGRGRYAAGVVLTVATGSQNALVRIGPAAYLNSNNWEFKQGETITIKAFKGTGKYEGEFFAAEVNQAGKQLILRDKDGLPQWRQSLQGKGRGQGRGRRR